MLFLLSFSCFADIRPNLAMSFSAGGRIFKSNIKKEQDRLIRFDEIDGSAVFVVARDGTLLFSGLLGSGQGNVPQTFSGMVSGTAPATFTPTSASQSIDLMQRKIPTQQWRGEQIQVAQVEIFGTHECPYCRYAQDLAFKTFGKENVTRYHIEDDQRYLQKSQDILKAAGRSDFNTVPRVSVIDNNNTRWFIGGFSDLQNFVTKNGSVSVMPASVSIAQSSSTTDFTQVDMPTLMYRQGTSIQPVQIEIFGAPGCPACVSAKALAIRNFGEDKVKTYDIRRSNMHLNISNNILRTVGWGDTSMPRISVIRIGKNGPKRLFLGGLGQLQSFINTVNARNPMVRRQQPQNSWSPPSKQTQSDRLDAITPVRQAATFIKKRYRGEY